MRLALLQRARTARMQAARCVDAICSTHEPDNRGRDRDWSGAALGHAKPHVGVIADGHPCPSGQHSRSAANCLCQTGGCFSLQMRWAPSGQDQGAVLDEWARGSAQQMALWRLSDGTLQARILTLPEALGTWCSYKADVDECLHMVTFQFNGHGSGRVRALGGLKEQKQQQFSDVHVQVDLAAVFFQRL